MPRPLWRRGLAHDVDVRVLLVWGVLALLVIGAALASPDFREPRNLLNILRQSGVLGLVAIGQLFVVLTAGIDLSVGSVVKLSTLVGAAVMAGQDGLLLPGLLIVVLVGILCGGANGLLIGYGRLPAFIVTFAAFFLIRGVAFALSTAPTGRAAPALYDLYSASWLGIPLILLPIAAVWLAAWYVLGRTAFGRHVYAVGGDEKAAGLSGVRVARTKLIAYVICAALAAAAGLFNIARMGVGDPRVAEGLELDAIAAVVLGGVSLFGGRGSIVGVLGAVLLLGVLDNVFNLLQIDAWYQQLFKGLVIVAAVAARKDDR